MNKVFELVEVTDEQVVIKVNANDNLTVARNPFISREYDYITVTRGGNHILTVIRKDGSTFNFSWGSGGYTLISDSMERLKREVVNFIKENYIILESPTDDFQSACIFYNPNYKAWQITFNGSSCYWSDTAKCVEDIMEEAKHWIQPKLWKHSIAITGIDVWDAVL